MDMHTSPPHLLRRRYRLAEWLSRGSIGEVYLARDESLDRLVVIKFLQREAPSPLENAGPDERSVRFLREARTVARLTHPNIMAIYDMGKEEGWDYLVLEYIAGGDLRGWQRQRGGAVPPAEVVPVAVSILEALAYAHEQGVVHRDIKPENILLSPAGQVKVADFGLARGKDDLRLTQAGEISGTIAYLAPECLRGLDSGPLADLYSCGAVVYELLTGRLPFDGENLAVVISKIIYGAFEPPRTFNPQIPPELDGFVLRLLAANPDQRFADAREALEKLGRIQTGLAGEPQTAAAGQARPGVVSTGAAGSLAGAVETDRRRLAGEIEASIIEPLKLLLAQANTFEQTLPAQPAARMAISVLSSLARQVLQRAYDLEANLRPAVLETLGLQPALETLANQYERTYNLRLLYNLASLKQRLPPALELEFFRLTQDVLEALRGQRVSQVALDVVQESGLLRLDFTFTTAAFLPEQVLAGMRRRLAALAGSLALGPAPRGQMRLSIDVPFHADIHFTEREQVILAALVRGLSNKQIAQSLTISPRTVNYHLDHIFSKLGVRTRTEAALIALRHGWGQRPDQAEPPV